MYLGLDLHQVEAVLMYLGLDLHQVEVVVQYVLQAQVEAEEDRN